MVRQDLERIKEFASNVLRPIEDEMKELGESKREEIKRFCKGIELEVKDFNEAWRRSKRDAPDQVEDMEEAMRGMVHPE